MPLILAIEPDRRQAAQLSVVVRKRVHAELILVDTTERALDAIGNRMPDLVLVPALLSPQDDAAIAAALRVIAAAAHVQLLTIPVLGAPRPAPAPGGVLSSLLRGKARAAEPDGCDPAVFAEQVVSYLERAARERPVTDVEMPPAYPLPTTAQIRLKPDPTTMQSVEETGVGVDAAVTVEDAFTSEWLQSLTDEGAEPQAAGGPDEGVSVAVEEAVRALFAEPAPTASTDFDLGPAIARSIERPFDGRGAAADKRQHDESATVEDLIASIHLIPLSAIDASDADEWMAPVSGRQFQSSDMEEVKATGAKSEREWVGLIESLRHDVERLRVERSEKAARKPAAAQPVRPARKAKPVQDEWGFFDPEQCGFAALLAKLDEVTESDDGRVNH